MENLNLKDQLEAVTESVITQDNVQPRSNGASAWFFGWFCLLVTVFLASTGLNSFFQWLSYGERFDLFGLVFSAILTILGYTWTLSSVPRTGPRARALCALILLALWMALFPMLMWAGGFKG